MKTLILAFLLVFAWSKPVLALTEDSIPVVCDNSKLVLAQLKGKAYQPVIIGETDKVQTAIFLNTKYELVIAITVKIDDKWTTCIFIGGETNTQTFDLPRRSSDNEKDI